MIVGFLLVFVAFGFFIAERRGRFEDRISEYKDISEFVEFVDFKLKCRAFSLCELAVEFLKEKESRGKYLSGIREAFLTSDAPAACECRLGAFFETESNLTVEDESFLKDFFKRFGKTELDIQRRQAADVLAEFKKRAAVQTELAEKKIKSEGLIFAVSFLGALILLI